MTIDLPPTVHLPSGRKVRLSPTAARSTQSPRSSDREAKAAPAPHRDTTKAAPAPHRDTTGDAPAPRSKPPEEGPFAAAIAILSAPGVLADDQGKPLDPLSLSVRDLHVLRALVTRAGLVEEETAEFTCENCGEPFEVAPSSLLEIGPFVDGELSDPELDAPFPFGEALSIPKVTLPAARARPLRRAAVAAKSQSRSTPRFAETVTFADRTGDQAMGLFRLADNLITGRARQLRITPAVVLGMGVVALGQERRTPVLAEALMDASNAAWAKVLARWHDAAYPRRLFAVHRCAKCGARNDLDVPLARELDREREPVQRARGRGANQPFPDLDAFQALVESYAEKIYAARGVRNIDLVVDAGVPHCDDGGEPLLGSYLPGGVDEDTGVPRAPEIRIYYRTFESERGLDPEFDVEGEIEETIDHEIEHHLHHLSGHDPMDEEERAAIDQEEIRRVGAKETARRSREQAVSSVSGFLRTTWPIWVAVLIATLITVWSRQ